MTFSLPSLIWALELQNRSFGCLQLATRLLDSLHFQRLIKEILHQRETVSPLNLRLHQDYGNIYTISKMIFAALFVSLPNSCSEFQCTGHSHWAVLVQAQWNSLSRCLWPFSEVRRMSTAIMKLHDDHEVDFMALCRRMLQASVRTTLPRHCNLQAHYDNSKRFAAPWIGKAVGPRLESVVFSLVFSSMESVPSIPYRVLC